MSEPDGNIRLLIEKIIDNLIQKKDTQAHIQGTLIIMGIEPNLETTLSYITGTVLGSAVSMWSEEREKEGKPIKTQEEDFKQFRREVHELLARRAMELRQHFVKEEYM